MPRITSCSSIICCEGPSCCCCVLPTSRCGCAVKDLRLASYSTNIKVWVRCQRLETSPAARHPHQDAPSYALLLRATRITKRVGALSKDLRLTSCSAPPTIRCGCAVKDLRLVLLPILTLLYCMPAHRRDAGWPSSAKAWTRHWCLSSTLETATRFFDACLVADGMPAGPHQRRRRQGTGV